MEKKFNAFTDLVPDGGMTAIFRTMAIFGDSLASGEQEYTKADGTNGYYDNYDLSWGQFMARKCGIKVTNYSRGGMTAFGFQGLAHQRMAWEVGSECQAYIIALGVNDSRRIDDLYKGEFGTMEDVDFENHENNKGSFVGYYCKIIQQIKKLQPYARIFVTTIPKSIQTETEAKTDERAAAVNAIRDRHAEFLRDLPNHFDRVYVIDLRAQDYYLDTPEFNRKYRLGGHLSNIGYKFFGDVFATYIDHIVNEKPEDFSAVGLLGTPYVNVKYMR